MSKLSKASFSITNAILGAGRKAAKAAVRTRAAASNAASFAAETYGEAAVIVKGDIRRAKSAVRRAKNEVKGGYMAARFEHNERKIRESL